MTLIQIEHVSKNYVMGGEMILALDIFLWKSIMASSWRSWGRRGRENRR
jgi:hypothetical protein